MNFETGEDAPEIPCPNPDCGETVRRGLVRCFACGMIMDPALRAKTAERATASVSAAEFTPLPEADPAPTEPDEPPSVPISDFFDDDEDDEPAGFADQEADFLLGDGIDVGEFDGEAEAELEEPDAADDDAAADDSDDEDSAAAAKTTADDIDVEPDDEPRRTDVEPDHDDGNEAESHADATAGEMLLKMAVAEEKKTGRIKQTMDPRRVKGGYTLSCVCGARVRVRDAHVGRMIACPNRQCWVYLRIPVDIAKRVADPEREKAVAAPADELGHVVEKIEAGDYGSRLRDITWHAVDPETVKKPKPGQFAKDGRPADLYAGKDGLLLVAAQSAGGGLFARGKAENPEAVREKVVAHFADGGGLDGLEVSDKRVLDVPALGLMQVDYPAASGGGRFEGVPVFGEGRVAVRLPATGGEELVPFLSMTLSQFRAFSRDVAAAGGPHPFGGDTDVPLEDARESATCHYTDATIESVARPEFYEADPAYETSTAGFRCGGCAVVVSEAGRKKEKIGGANGKSLEKAVCPKCGKRFGRNPLVNAVVKLPQTAEA